MSGEPLTKLVEILCELGRKGAVIRLLSELLAPPADPSDPGQVEAARIREEAVRVTRDRWLGLLSEAIGLPRPTTSLVARLEWLDGRLTELNLGARDLTVLLEDLREPEQRLWSERRLLPEARATGALVLEGLEIGIAAGLAARPRPPVHWQAQDQQGFVGDLLRHHDADPYFYPDTEPALHRYWGRSLGLAYVVAALAVEGLCVPRRDVLYIGSVDDQGVAAGDLAVHMEGGERAKILAAFEDAGVRIVVVARPDPHQRAGTYSRDIERRRAAFCSLAENDGLRLRVVSLDDSVDGRTLAERYRGLRAEVFDPKVSLSPDDQDLLIVEIGRLGQLGELGELLFEGGAWHLGDSLNAKRPAPLRSLLAELDRSEASGASPARQFALISQACDCALRVLLLCEIRLAGDEPDPAELCALFLTRPGEVPRTEEGRGRLRWIGDLLRQRVERRRGALVAGQAGRLARQLDELHEVLYAPGDGVGVRVAELARHVRSLLQRVLRLFPGEGELSADGRWKLEDRLLDLSPLVAVEGGGSLYWEGPAGRGSSGGEAWLYDPSAGTSRRSISAYRELRDRFGAEAVTDAAGDLRRQHPQASLLDSYHRPLTGRGWLFERLAKRREAAGPDRSVTLLTAPAGWGKSAISAALLRHQPTCLSFFFRRERAQHNSAEALAESLFRQLCSRLGVERERPRDRRALRVGLQELLEELAKRLAQGTQREWLVIDGLDEAEDPRGCLDLIDLGQLGPGFDVLLTARPDGQNYHFLWITLQRDEATLLVRQGYVRTHLVPIGHA